MRLRTLKTQQNPDEPSRCCPGHQTCLECPASPHDSRKVEEVDDNGDEVRESLVTRRDDRSARAPEPAAARPESLQLPDALSMFYGIECIDGSINALPVEEEPEFIETEMTLDTGATVHAADRADLPAHQVLASAGSKAGQQFGCAGGKLVANEGECKVHMLAPGGGAFELELDMQIAKITRPLLSVTQMIRHGTISVLCKREEALVLNEQNETVAVFKKKGGLYVANMRVRNPRFKAPFGRPAR